MRYYLLSLGCQMNISDSERVCTVLNGMGMTKTENEEEAELLGIMACSVRQKAVDKVYTLIHKWNKRKQEHPCITFLSGCVLPADREKWLKQFDLLFSINELPQFPTLLKQYGVSTAFSASFTDASSTELLERQDITHHSDNSAALPASAHSASPLRREQEAMRKSTRAGSAHTAPHTASHSAHTAPHTASRTASPVTLPATKHVQAAGSDRESTFARGFWNIAPSNSSSFKAYVSIQNGCDKFCTFCAVPYTRGREVSRPSGQILKEVHDLMLGGYKSITLLGQNVNSYGVDMEGRELSFTQLLERIGNLANELQHDCWVYFTSPHPRDMGRETLEVIAKYPCLAKHIHLPLQSGDDKLLLKMNRNHSMDKYRSIVKNIQTLLPDATLFTDIIVGFCGENEEQFANTRNAMEEFQYNMAYIAMYSPRPGATSYRWHDNVPPQIKKQRYHELSEILKKSAFAKNKHYAGRQIKVLVEEIGRKPGTLLAKTEGKIPVILQTNTSIPSSKLLGNFHTAEITEAQSLSLLGKICETTNNE